MAPMINPFDAGGYTLAEMTTAINILPNIYTWSWFSEPHGYDEFIATVDTLVLGRKTFEIVMGFEGWHYGERRVVVLSRQSIDLAPATARGGRVESAARSGELKKQIQMVTEGSVLAAATAPHGAAADVEPDGFPHPVFRAGFALCIPLPEVG